MDIAEFLMARLAEREQLARAATPGPWLVERNEEDSGSLAIKGGPDQLPTVSGNETVAYDPTGWDESARNFAHIAAWDPTYVLAEVAAKRVIIHQHSEPHECPAWDKAHGRVTDYVTEDECRTLRALAAPDNAHPDYDPAWAVI